MFRVLNIAIYHCCFPTEVIFSVGQLPGAADIEDTQTRTQTERQTDRETEGETKRLGFLLELLHFSSRGLLIETAKAEAVMAFSRTRCPYCGSHNGLLSLGVLIAKVIMTFHPLESFLQRPESH